MRGRGPSGALRVRLEYDAAAGVDVPGLTRRLADRLRERLGVRAELELVARGAVPRFAYKAARVVDA